MSTTAKATHTAGPWVAGRADMATVVDGVASKWIYGGTSGNEYVAVASGRIDGGWDEVMANAELIADAPTLLDALAELVLDDGAKSLAKAVALDLLRKHGRLP